MERGPLVEAGPLATDPAVSITREEEEGAEPLATDPAVSITQEEE